VQRDRHETCRGDRGQPSIAAPSLALDVLDGGVVQEPVEDGARDDLVGEHLAPVAEAPVAGQHDRAALVSSTDDLEHPVRAGRVHWQVAELVDDQDRRPGVRPHLR
jgi:hypothetical protein